MFWQLFKSAAPRQQLLIGAITVPGFGLGWYMTEALVDQEENIFTRTHQDNMLSRLKLYSVSNRTVSKKTPSPTLSSRFLLSLFWFLPVDSLFALLIGKGCCGRQGRRRVPDTETQLHQYRQQLVQEQSTNQQQQQEQQFGGRSMDNMDALGDALRGSKHLVFARRGNVEVA
ncbi:hypothetical protein BC829DRAFT_408233 [Chytridium lagenaria]|nr:hypothetical protein BC829DRAFT_408233 [Chytridium lagenaria]